MVFCKTTKCEFYIISIKSTHTHIKLYNYIISMVMISISEKSNQTIINLVAEMQKESGERCYIHHVVDELCDFYTKNNKGDKE